MMIMLYLNLTMYASNSSLALMEPVNQTEQISSFPRNNNTLEIITTPDPICYGDDDVITIILGVIGAIAVGVCVAIFGTADDVEDESTPVSSTE